ncbi:M23 family metallopeptidase [Schumannella sp. 10F1B-5-1]|uniref:M23 family metallopeptidase n=1 Tax=Schumannella sp. 10F1B-5-1 TaxID=2590780 RepID=UPI001131F8CB|nr:M23 family metallopeptidase [Schumannella sp. 10F1B-5-1]TPW71555.1 M23 family metallopeptidase [Schumannella sp. 10F1B-5-1]
MPPASESSPLTRRDLRARQQSAEATRAARTARPLARAGRASRPARGAGYRRGFARQVLSAGVLIAVFALVVSVSVPASVFGTPSADAATTGAPLVGSVGDTQTFRVSADAAADDTSRDAYGATSRAEFLAAANAAAAKKAKASASQYSSTWNPGIGPVRWPYQVMPKLGPGFGAPATCSTCMSVHQGQDYLAASGTPIYSIATGIVTKRQEDGYGWGNHIVITSSVNGQTVSFLYAHTQSGSISLQVGDTVEVGQFVGLTGSTGSVTAPHLHLELQLNGTKVNPHTWLQANVTG